MKRTELVSFRASPAEKNFIVHRARRQGLDTSNFLRSLVYSDARESGVDLLDDVRQDDDYPAAEETRGA